MFRETKLGMLVHSFLILFPRLGLAGKTEPPKRHQNPPLGHAGEGGNGLKFSPWLCTRNRTAGEGLLHKIEPLRKPHRLGHRAAAKPAILLEIL